jgi:hypothetical protein
MQINLIWDKAEEEQLKTLPSIILLAPLNHLLGISAYIDVAVLV